MREYVVYILRCVDGSYYTGVTNNLSRRLDEHVRGRNEGCYTCDRRPVTLVFCTSFQYVKDAIHYEKVVKDWSWKKRDALIRGDMNELQRLAKKKFPKRYKRSVAAAVRMLQEAIEEVIWDCVG